MRVDSVHKYNHLHWHDGSTCHGFPTLRECLDHALDKGWVGKILQKDDEYQGGKQVSCYSLIASSFEHWEKQGKFVAVIELTYRILNA